MPNQEIKYEWANCSFGVTDSGMIGSSFQQDIMNALRAESFSIESMQTLMGGILLCCSCLDTQSKNSYHMYFLGIFTGVCGPKAISNREAGHGQYEITIALEDMMHYATDRPKSS